MLRRKPFRLVLSDTLGELEAELKESQLKAEQSTTFDGSDSGIGLQFFTPEKPSQSKSINERIGYDGPSPSA